MLPRRNRLIKDLDIKKVKKSRNFLFSPCFKLSYLQNQLDISRFTVVISVKASKKATVRNRLKRQVRDVIHAKIKEIKSGYDIIISGNSKAVLLSYGDIRQELLRLFKKAGIL